MMMRSPLLVFVCVLALCCVSVLGSLTKIYALWHCGDDSCTWAVEPNLASSQWIVNRGDGKPTANIVNIAFINPVSLLHGTTDSGNVGGIPKGITTKVVDFFQSKGITVILSIGGAAYSQLWDQALQADPVTLAKNAAAVAKRLNVGIEIDYEQDSTSSMNALDTFVKTYRQAIPYQAGDSPSAPSILTVDLGAGTGYLTSLSKQASVWLNSSQVNWAYAMVTGGPYGSLSEATQYWQQHLDGVNWAQIPPIDPKKFAVSLYASSQSRNCPSYSGTVLEGTVGWANQKNVRGIAFWSAGCPSAPNNCATNCTGIQTGSKNFLG